MPSSPIKLSPSNFSLTPHNFNTDSGKQKSSPSQVSGTNNPVTLLLCRKRPTNNNNNNNNNNPNNNFNNLVVVKESSFSGDQETAYNNSNNNNNNNNNNSDNIQNNFVSPYYRGLLTNESLIYYNNFASYNVRQKSHATRSSTSSKASLASTIFTKFKGLGNSCYQFKRKRKKADRDDDDDEDQKETASTGLIGGDKNVTTITTTNNKNNNNNALSLPNYYYSLPSSSSIITTTSNGNNVDAKGEEERGGSNSEKKPLRESVTVSSSSSSSSGLQHADVEGLHDDHDEPIISAASLIAEEEKAAKIDEIMISTEFEWADKYRPLALEDFICNKSKAIQLQAQARNGECGHYIFQGSPGVGKRTMILAMIREAFGPLSIQATEHLKVFKLKGEIVESVEVAVKESPWLVQVNISEFKGYEKHILYDLIMENSTKTSRAFPCKPPHNCRAIIFNGVDKLSTDAILYIQWLMERYEVCNKIFFCCDDVSKLQAITNLCTVVHLLPPSKTEIIEVLKFIADKEAIELPIQVATKIANNSKNNLRQAIRSFEATWLKHYPFKEDQEVLTGWEDDIANIAKNMIHEQSPRQLYVIRGKLENLVEHDVSPEFIFQSLADELKKHLDEIMTRRVHNLYMDFNIKIDESMVKCDKTMAQTRKDNEIRQRFLRIEEFIAKFMSFYKAESNKKNA